jgi:hypothetical protein
MSTRIYREMCDASAAARIGGSELFAAATDEDCILRVYDRATGGAPVERTDVTAFLEPDDPGQTEADIEGAAQIGDRIYWIGSHGRNKNGKVRKIRQRLFATTVQTAGGRAELTPSGVPYKQLLQDVLSTRALDEFDLRTAETLAPEAQGGLNIEGLAPTPGGELLIGFRNPIPRGRALIVKLHNPAALVDGSGSSAQLSVGGHLNLDGRGIRALEFVPSPGVYIIIAGSFDNARDFRLYRWSGRRDEDAVPVDAGDLSGLNPEELIVAGESGDGVVVDLLSDDGDSPIGGGSCKDAQASMRQFSAVTRSLRI